MILDMVTANQSLLNDFDHDMGHAFHSCHALNARGRDCAGGSW